MCGERRREMERNGEKVYEGEGRAVERAVHVRFRVFASSISHLSPW